MAFYVSMVNSLVPLPMSNFTNDVIPTYFQFIQTPNTKQRFGIIYDEIFSLMIEIWMRETT